MRKSKNILKYTETALIAIVWVLMIAIPIIFAKDVDVFAFDSLEGPIITYIPLLIIFLINRYLLVPKLLLKKKNLGYVVSVIGLIGIFALGLHLFQQNNQFPEQHAQAKNRPMHLPPSDANGLAEKSIPPPYDRQHNRQPLGPPPFANLIIISFLLVGFDTGLNAFARLNEAEKDRSRLEKENVANELDMLRHQVSPHFLMNTLNNIHTLIDISSEKAKDAVIMLSKLMRYLLYDTADNVTTIKNEVSFIESYIELMKLRVSDKVDIILNIPSELPDKKIPPLLFTSYIENAFKHGISYKQKSFIIIDISTDNNHLLVKVDNSIHQKSSTESASGIGIINARKRLDLLYGNNYQLEIREFGDTFAVQLKVPFNDKPV